MGRVSRVALVALIVISIFLVFAVALASPIALWWGYDVWQDRKHAVAVSEDVPVFVGVANGSCGGSQITVLTPGSKVSVRRIRHWKNCATIDVRCPDGRAGYIVFDSRQMTISPSLP